MAKFNTMKYLDRGAMFLALFLFAFYAISFGANHHWISERYTHTTPQYVFYSLIFGAYFLIRKSWIWLALMVTVFIPCLYGTISAIHFPQHKQTSEKTIKIAIYNKLYYLHDHTEMRDWIITESPDIIAIQEANKQTGEMVKTLELYPHIVEKLTSDPFGMILLSKHPIIKSDIVTMDAGPQDNFYIHALIKVEDHVAVSIYTAHTAPPVNHVYFAQRNREFNDLISAVKKETQTNILVLGDLNVTPYSPYFKRILTQTGLKNEYTSFIPPPTWTSFRPDYIFQIPIDHILHKGDLELVDKRRGPAMGSDHYPLIATFSIPE